MFIGYCKTNIFIPQSRSLKDRRRVVSRIKQRIRGNFNVSLAEKPSNKWQVCELSFVCVNYTREYVSQMISKIEDLIRLNCDIHVLETEKEIL